VSSIALAGNWPELASNDQEVTHFNVRLIGGRYRVERLLGKGGSALVQQVLDQSTGARLALKQLKLPDDRRRARRAQLGFRREFHTLATLRHPNIVAAHDFGIDPSGPFYTMELLDGEALQRTQGMDASQVVRVLLDVAGALAFLHGRRLIHGDISRKNIGCAPDGMVKLLDFGLLVTVGDLGKGGGTLPYMAPEVARHAPLDHRTDLFSLGALAYVLLVGRHAYPAQERKELEQHWSRRPAPPARLDPSLPAALSDLVVSLLSVDPLGRPSSAAEVIDRLRAVTAAPEVSRNQVVRGYLASSALVGRQREMEALRTALVRARSGAGTAVMVQAPSGMGKSRVLRELAVEAQLGGARVLSTGCETTGRGPYGVLHELVQELLRASTPPDGLTVIHRADHALPALQRWVGILEGKGDDQRVQLQRLLAERVLAEAEQQPLVLIVDDLQRCDEASAAVLATIAYEASRRRVLLVCAIRTDESILAPDPLGQLRRHARALVLEGLQAREVQQLVRAIFGDVDHVERLARWMHTVSDGAPLRCTELARQLVEQGKIRYQDGVWRIPDSIGTGALPRRLVDAMAQRIGALSIDGLELAETLAIHGGELSLELCVALSVEEGEEATFDALNELVQNEFLIGTRDRMRFRHDGIREALLANMSDGRRRQIHLRVGQLLERNSVGGGCLEATGWHLLRGGDELKGARLLAMAGMAQFKAQSFADAVGPLEAALEVFERLDVVPRLRCQIRQDLVRAGVICNREVALRHGGRAISELHHHAGLDLARRLGRWLGRSLGLGLALMLTWLRWLLTRPSRRGVRPSRALHTYVSIVNYVTAARALSFDLDGVRAMPALFDPLPRWARGVRCAQCMCSNFELMLTGQWEQAEKNAHHYLSEVPYLMRIIDNPLDIHVGAGAMRYMLAFTSAHRAGPKCLDHLEQLESAEVTFVEVSGRVGRVLFHRLRGEEELAQSLEAEVKVLLVQMGAMWLWESLLTWLSAIAHCLTRNLPALRQSIEQLEGLVARGVGAEPFLDLSRGVYHQERGEFEASRRVLSRLVYGEHCRDNPMMRQAALGALARTLVLQDDLHGAVAVARQGAEMGRDPASGILHFHVLSAGTLALARARTGEGDKAVRRLEGMLEAMTQNPLLCGTLHEYAAQAAHLARNSEAAARHLTQVSRCFRSTNNPALVARVEKLAATIVCSTHPPHRTTSQPGCDRPPVGHACSEHTATVPFRQPARAG